MLLSSRLEDHMKTVGIDRSSFNMSTFEHICMNNIKKIYQHTGKCDDQQNLKDIIEATLLSTPEVFIDNSTNVHMTATPFKNQVIVNNYVYSQTYWMFNLKQKNVVLLLQIPTQSNENG